MEKTLYITLTYVSSLEYHKVMSDLRKERKFFEESNILPGVFNWGVH